MRKPRLKEGDRVIGEFGDEGVIERILQPNRWRKEIRYLVRFVHEYGGKKHIVKFQYGEQELVRNTKKKRR